jgi:hypothetical protein
MVSVMFPTLMTLRVHRWLAPRAIGAIIQVPGNPGPETPWMPTPATGAGMAEAEAEAGRTPADSVAAVADTTAAAARIFFTIVPFIPFWR